MGKHRLGYVAQCLSLKIGASHTCRVANATPARLLDLIAQNLAELEQILLFNEKHGIQVFRIGSSLVPLASHPVNELHWWKHFARDFDEIGAIARRSGQRLSMHPSPAGASLASARPEVRLAAEKELLYSTRVLDMLGQGPEARVVLHVGGAAPDRATAMDAAHRMLDALPDDARRRIAVEHDDRTWSAREVFPLARAHGLPFLADPLHNAVLPSDPVVPIDELFRMANTTWLPLGLRPKHHLASQKKDGPPGAHADYIDPKDYREAVAALELPSDFMIEAKQKDLALFRLQRTRLEPAKPKRAAVVSRA
ncbi:UV DNA damage repair endonuclease UvsE [Polyangium sp. 15x6]|uniref:UV DNA damage repair endonuclease UvsE n=1 Tax=Polyangium sp. 15x6 TaxID=3042687 RepID=UPI00249BFAE7|nr:UV DNA damage repair endonuclease UvsE [Polyangium sp. 15x6]MDI3282600.1 UV DNA damage repair endonuclease UvsE [Polyangium sp. 15x6]